MVFIVTLNKGKIYLLREKRPYLEFFWSVFSHLWEMFIQMQENAGQKNSKYGRFLCSFYLLTAHFIFQEDF